MNQTSHNQYASRIALTLALVGFFAQFGQILTFREIMASAHGGELLLGSVLAFCLIWGAVGAVAGSRLVTSQTPIERTCDLLTLTWVLSSPILVLQILLVRLVAWMPYGTSGAFMPLVRSFLMVAVCVAPVSLVCGFQIVVALRSLPEDRNSHLYRAAAWGAMLGGLATALWFSVSGQSVQDALICGALLFALVGRILQRQYPLILEKCSIALIGILLSVGLLVPVDRWSEEVRWTHALPGYKLSKVEDTRYGRLTVLKDQPGLRTQVFQNGAMVGSYEESSEDPVARQLSTLIGLQHPGPDRVLFIGGALSRLPQYMLKHEPQQLGVIGLDPALFALAREAGLLPLGDSRLASVAGDARLLIKRAPAAFWDLVVVVLPEPDNVGTNRYCTMEFFQNIQRILRPDGVLCLILPSYGTAAEYTGPLLARRSASVLAAMARVFAVSRVVPIGGHLFVATNKPEQISFDPDLLAARLNARKELTPWSEVIEHGQVLRRLLEPSEVPTYLGTILGGVLAKQVSPGGASYRQPLLERFQELLRNTPAEVNRDPQPISVLYGFCLSESVSHLETVGSVGRWVLKLLDAIASGRMDVTLIIAVAMSILLLAVAGCKRTRWGSEKLAGLNSVTLMALATGTFGTVAMVSLLFIHQNLSGYIYVELGIPSSAFLGGLGLGLLLAERSNDRFALRLLGMTLLMVGVCLVSSHLLQWVFSFGARTWSVHVATSALSSLSGIGVGATFSFLAAINRQRGRQQPRAWIHVAEMVGASAAAVATNVFFIPVLGVAKVFYLEALLLVVAAVTLLAGEVHRHRSSEVSRPER